MTRISSLHKLGVSLFFLPHLENEGWSVVFCCPSGQLLLHYFIFTNLFIVGHCCHDSMQIIEGELSLQCIAAPIYEVENKVL